MAGLRVMRHWIATHPIRTCAYGLVSYGLLTFSALMSMREGVSLSWFLHQPLVQQRLNTLGVKCSAKTLHLGWFRDGCRLWLKLSDLDVRLHGGQDSLRFQLKQAQFRWNRDLLLKGILVGNSVHPGLVKAVEITAAIPFDSYSIQGGEIRDAADQPVLKADSLGGLVSPLRLRSHGVQVLPDPSSGNSLLLIEALSSENVHLFPGVETRIVVDNVTMEGANFNVVRGPSGDWNVSRLGSLQEVSKELFALLLELLHRGSLLGDRLHRILSWMIIVMVGLIFLAKYLVTAQLRRSSMRWLLAACTAAFPLVAFAGFRAIFPARTVLLAGVLIGAALAFVFRQVIYRHAVQWHQRWEPMVVDFLSPVLLFSALLVWSVSLALPDVQRLNLQVENLAANDTMALIDVPGCPLLSQSRAVVSETRVQGFSSTVDLSSA